MVLGNPYERIIHSTPPPTPPPWGQDPQVEKHWLCVIPTYSWHLNLTLMNWIMGQKMFSHSSKTFPNVTHMFQAATVCNWQVYCKLLICLNRSFAVLPWIHVDTRKRKWMYRKLHTSNAILHLIFLYFWFLHMYVDSHMCDDMRTEARSWH